MSHNPHDLHAAFPDAGEILQRLKLDNAHFQKLSARYHDLSKDLHRIEAGVTAAADDWLEGLKKQRLAVLDEIAGMIAKARSTVH